MVDVGYCYLMTVHSGGQKIAPFCFFRGDMSVSAGQHGASLNHLGPGPAKKQGQLTEASALQSPLGSWVLSMEMPQWFCGTS